ncbi:MAG: penicillin-binding protein activator [Methylococcaceae bacterium]
MTNTQTRSSATLFPLLSLLTLIGCSATPKNYPSYPLQQGISRAEKLTAIGKYREAAVLYEDLATQKNPKQNSYRLLAAESLIYSGDTQNAKAYLDMINLARLSKQQLNKLYLLRSQIYMNRGNPKQALAQLDHIDINYLAARQEIYFHHSKGQAFAMLKNPLASAKERILNDRLIEDPGLRFNNQKKILLSLTEIPVRKPKESPGLSYDVTAGWIALAKLLPQNTINFTQKQELLTEWQQTYPDHPAMQDLIDQYMAEASQPFEVPNVVAVLLPETEAYARAALAIKQGIMTAYLNNPEFQPEIQFYDTQADDPYEIYQQALDDGADLIIGPLIKENIERISQDPSLQIPVLALNTINQPIPGNLLQFGLNPIDEVVDVANKAWSDGHRKALVIVPQSDLGDRAASFFADYWLALGGTVLSSQAYPPKDNDYSRQIKNLFNLSESTNRFKQLKRLIPSLNFEPRKRQDADFIFMVGSPRQARLLRPQFQFYKAAKLPIYATSHSFSGKPDISKDRDLNDVLFCDIPWLFGKNRQPGFDPDQLQQTWQEFPEQYTRLFALGVDTFNMIPKLEIMREQTYSGLTGNLSLDENNQIKRNLYCAKFRQGTPQTIGFAPQLELPETPVFEIPFDEEIGSITEQ